MSVCSSNYQAPIYQVNDLSELKLLYKKPSLYNKTLEVTKAFTKDEEINNETVYIQVSHMELKNINKEKNMLTLSSSDKDLYDFFYKLDKHNISTIYAKRKNWFYINEEDDLGFEDIIESYKKVYVKWNEDTQTFEFKGFYDDYDEVPIFNSFKEKIEFDNINENDDLCIIFEYIGIRFDEEEYFPLFMIKQIKLNEHKTLDFTNYCFQESDHSDDDTGENELDELFGSDCVVDEEDCVMDKEDCVTDKEDCVMDSENTNDIENVKKKKFNLKTRKP
jgi:hypothetical protein